MKNSKCKKDNNLIMSDLRKYSKIYFQSEEKRIINHFDWKYEKYNIGVIQNFISYQKMYEIYLFVESPENIVSNLFAKCISSKFLADLYFKKLVRIAKKNKLAKYLN